LKAKGGPDGVCYLLWTLPLEPPREEEDEDRDGEEWEEYEREEEEDREPEEELCDE
jgi:hypothetical protein